MTVLDALNWPVLKCPRLAGFKVSPEAPGRRRDHLRRFSYGPPFAPDSFGAAVQQPASILLLPAFQEPLWLLPFSRFRARPVNTQRSLRLSEAPDTPPGCS